MTTKVVKSAINPTMETLAIVSRSREPKIYISFLTKKEGAKECKIITLSINQQIKHGDYLILYGNELDRNGNKQERKVIYDPRTREGFIEQCISAY
ncbi:MAG: hypothetical protein MNSN_00200 [Minisyncoccus archaeiphilus]|jgi:hypothetical protein|uniref:hypothetical protein n=1 Tax=Minisyncoccus archaeiphilus TaxID=3238481 RepID=UPI0009C6B86E|nr:MAG: hypothetical protein BWY21_00196 [Parcubacteria group bacterium ADurb.Bin216]GMX59026.1 MAG: hypothetical protein MNSN_00200 [Candidatus Parcubacteria bacterium]